MPAAAVTDRGTLAGIGKFYRAARDEGVKPVIGLELYEASDRHSRSGVKERNAHLTLPARDEAGYGNPVKPSARVPRGVLLQAVRCRRTGFDCGTILATMIRQGERVPLGSCPASAQRKG
jgi:hypothetical protein